MDDLQRLAKSFAAELTALLNGTVTDGIRISAFRTTDSPRWCDVAPRTAPESPNLSYLPLKIGRRRATGYLFVGYRTRLDDEGRYLTVQDSNIGLYLEADRTQMLLHYDYIRQPGNPYPAAHVQIDGTSSVLSRWREACGLPPRALERLHLPVGGRRFRPALEDVIEFLIVEDLARPRSGWDKLIADHRNTWARRQLRAAVRRDPDSAAAELTDAGYRVIAPAIPSGGVT